MPSSRGSSQPRDRTQVSYIAGRFFTIGTTTSSQKTASFTLYSCSNFLFLQYFPSWSVVEWLQKYFNTLFLPFSIPSGMWLYNSSQEVKSISPLFEPGLTCFSQEMKKWSVPLPSLGPERSCVFTYTSPDPTIRSCLVSLFKDERPHGARTNLDQPSTNYWPICWIRSKSELPINLGLRIRCRHYWLG